MFNNIIWTVSFPGWIFGAVESNLSVIFHLDEVDCDGEENSLIECDHRGLGVHDCAGDIDRAGVLCTSKHSITSTQ